LVSVWPTNSSNQLKPGLSKDRFFAYQTAVAIFTGTTGVTTLTIQSISAAVPFNGKIVRLAMCNTTTSAAPLPSIAGDNIGTDAYMFSASNLAATYALPSGIPNQANVMVSQTSILTPQNIYWMEPHALTNNSMYVLSYNF
jgi:hypothetical protein